MREIKFRAWNGKKMLNNEDTLNLLAYSVKNVEYMQYTGLKDKNGKEIYKGDIVKVRPIGLQGCPKTLPVRAQVVWIEKDMGFDMRSKEGYSFGSFSQVHFDTAEIIGNIYQTPELLK